MIDRDILVEKIVDISCGLVASTVDLLLFSIMVAEPTFSSDYRDVSRKMDKAIDEVMGMGIDKETVKRAIHKAINRRYIKRVDKKTISVTEDGWTKINAIFPTYQTVREWDGKLFLVTYDIPETKKKEREALRRLVARLGGGLLQKSVWVCFFDPKPLLKRFASENNLQGTIIVSDLGKEGAIGEEDLDDLVGRVFRLESKNKEYVDFISQLREGNLSHSEAVFRYLAILDGDPQLPFEVLPYYWRGDKAYKLIKKYCPSRSAIAD